MDLALVRQEFPVTKTRIYLDNASLSPLPKRAVDAATAELQERSERGVDGFWNWLATLDRTRESVARLIGAGEEEVTFTQNTSEGINIVASMLDWREGDNVILNDLEYFPNAYPWLKLRRRGIEPRIVRHRRGRIDPGDIAAAADRRTRVVALSHVAWINGLRHDLSAIAEICRSVGAYFCVDAIQSLGALPVDVRSGVDFLAAGSHKWLLAPLGLGIFYCRKELLERFDPPYAGWQSDDRGLASQEYGFRDVFQPGHTARRFNHGNINIAAVHGLAASLTLLEELGWNAVFARNRMLADRVVERLKSAGMRFLSPLDNAMRSQIINVLPRDLTKTMSALAAANIAVSSRAGGVRISPAFYNTEDEVDRLIEVMLACERG
ncbi:MAG TPA: aminotransferase class V-fold PLP-dependent enzyme [Stellaceae bacterium]|nr:aminotransferase class V-fold PLP-dependent enzyme [Stellaceae bacterium]